MTDSDLRAKIEGLIAAPLSNAALVRALSDFAEADSAAFTALAEVWAFPLYERDLFFFETFLVRYLPKESTPTIEALLVRAEQDGKDEFFERMYGWLVIHDNGRRNRDLRTLLDANLSDYDLRRALLRRGNTYGTQIDDDILSALYRRNPEEFRDFVIRALPYSEAVNYWQVLNDFAELEPGSDHHRQIFQRVATGDDWAARIREMMPTHREWKAARSLFESWRPHTNPQLPLDVAQEILRKYGKQAQAFINQRVEHYAEQIAAESLKAEAVANLNDAEFVERLQHLSGAIGYAMYERAAKTWGILLYERNSATCDSYLVSRICWNRNYRELARNILQRAKADKRHTLYHDLFPNHITNEEWNAELLDVATAPHSDDAFIRELERLDGGYFVISDDAATALYDRLPGSLWAFSMKRLNVFKESYTRLLERVRQHDPHEAYPALYRRVARGSNWNEHVQRMLAEDIPADQILAELNRWHPINIEGADTNLLKQLLDRYGEAIMPYLERSVNWASEERLQALLALDIPRGDLLRELVAIASRQPVEFAELAKIWAPTLYKKGPDFFGAFLVRYLDNQHEYLIRELLPQIEADGRTELFRDLYGRMIRPEGWNAELARLIDETESDADLEQVLLRRDVTGYGLTEENALALYERDYERAAPHFRDFITRHLGSVRRRWWSDDDANYSKLEAAAQKRGDTDLVKQLMRRGAYARYWEFEVADLVKNPIPGDQALKRLEALHPQNTYEIRHLDILIDIVQVYGFAVMPYIMQHLSWVDKHERLLEAIRALGDEPTFWNAFFVIGAPSTWNFELTQLMNRQLPTEDFFAELSLRTPRGNNASRWGLTQDNALRLYSLYGARVRPLIESTLGQPSMELFEAAKAAGDEEFLDFIIYRLLLLPNSYAYQRQRTKQVESYVGKVSSAVLGYFEYLHTQSPERYVRHAANVLGRFRAFSITTWSDVRVDNPIYEYLATKHHEAWVRSSAAIRDLLETPEIHIQLLALEMLSKGGPDAAARVVENLRQFRAILLGGARKSTKEALLRCLEMAAYQGPDFAAQIYPKIEDTMDYRAQRAIPEAIMSAYVRIRRAANVPQTVSNA